MTNNEITTKIQKISITVLTGIMGIIVFINTALTQQAQFLGIDQLEIKMIIKGINIYSFILIMISIFFFLAAMPAEELWISIKRLFNKNTDKLSSNLIFNVRLVTFILGVITFSVVFVIYLIRFALILI